MKTVFLRIVASLLRLVLKARYRVKIEGFRHLETDGPVLVLPNHVALIDPVIITAFFAPGKILSPLISETYYRMPALKPVLDLVSAIPIADVQRGSSGSGIAEAFDAVTAALAEGRSALMYPSGQIYLQGFESVVGKKGAHAVVSDLPENVRVLTVRTTGLWGSMFGKAFAGDSPNLAAIVPKAIFAIFANAFVFLSKRDVTVEIEDRTEELRRLSGEGSQAFNANLEAWYNRYGKEHCAFIKYFPVFDSTHEKTEPEAIPGSVADLMRSASSGNASKPAIDAAIEEVRAVKGDDAADAAADSVLALDLHCDSLDLAELKTRMQKRFPAASNPPVSALKTVLDLALMADGKLGGDDAGKPCEWGNGEDAVLTVAEGDFPLRTIVAGLRREKGAAFLFDELSGTVSRFAVLTRAFVVAARLKELPGDRVAVMLPASVGAAVVLLGAFLARKTPVMLNWTVGEAAFAHCLRNGGTETIVTSRKFFERAVPPNVRERFGGNCRFLEDLLGGVSFVDKAVAAASALALPVPATNRHDTAVVLFTSGSESLPKPVALTWDNVVSDVAGAISVMPVRGNDVLFSFLPVFHSFGFTIGTMLPLLTGLKTAYTPDPNDGRTVARGIAKTRATILTSTPTFFKLALEAADPGSLGSLEKLVVGAEKCPTDLFERLKKEYPKIGILEGYGITECSPVISINPPGKTKPGSIGTPIPCCEVRIFPLDGGGEPCPAGTQGMIYARGPNVFRGYGDPGIASPFETVGGTEWYKTGDLGYLDADGYLWITGRLKRFVKIAGEMVSLPAMESMLAEAYPSESGLPELAVEAKEEDGKAKIVCFSVRAIPLAEANAALRSRGAG